ncbi:MAG: MFS transporter, partial [Gammaproteobacteria bacterium]|nr:MFS transporter [Gammaproteobacteria bacterium]
GIEISSEIMTASDILRIIRPMQRRNLAILISCQLISATGSIVFVTLGGIIGATLTSKLAWATLPISVAVLATAVTTVPATLIMRALGRSKGFALASMSAAIGVCLAAWALRNASFALFLFAAALFGINMAFTQQYRYAAAESVETRYIPRAISFVLIGSIGGAFVGPELAKHGQSLFGGVQYSGTMLGLGVLYTVQALLFLMLQPVSTAHEYRRSDPQRSVQDILRQPLFLVAVLGATAGYGLMTLIMTATPLSMHLNDGYSVEATANVIRAHVLGMYVPSLVSGLLIEKLGVVRMMFTGALALMAASIIGMQGHAVTHYWWALLLLGVGWNFLFVGGTTMLTYTYSMAERFRAQAVNEFLIFGTSATASLLAGSVMHYFGWDRLMWIPLPVLLLVCMALVVVRKDTLLLRDYS